MLHFRDLDSIHLAESWITIGTYDGIHVGHQVIIHRLVDEARAAGVPSAVITFFPSPAVVLGRTQGRYYLTLPDEKAHLLAKMGVDYVITLPFDLAMAAMTAEEFMSLLSRRLGVKRLYVGFDFALGRNRQGDLTALKAIGNQLRYDLIVIPRITVEGEQPSSRIIRRLIMEGKVVDAQLLLGRPYQLGGKVIYGDQRGKSLGIPTANLDVHPEQILPAYGIYATWTWLNNRRYASVANVGERPTFDSHRLPIQVESHILDFDQDIYGEYIQLDFIQFLRPEIRYPSVQDMLDQIKIDIQQSREVLSYAP